MIIATMAMVVVLFAPAHSPSSPVFAEYASHVDMHTSVSNSVAHTNHHGAVHEHVKDILSSSVTTLPASSVPQRAWRQDIARGAPVSLDFTPFQPPKA